MKKIYLFILCCLLLASGCLAADYSVSRLTTQCVVESGGELQLSQRIELSVEQPVEQLLIPVASSARGVSVSGVKARVVRRDGSTYLRLQPGEGFTGTLEMTVSYHARGTVEVGEQSQLYTAELVSPLWEQKVDRYAFQVTLPKETAAQPSFFSTYRADDIEDDLSFATEGRAVSGQLRGGLLDREGFTLCLTVPEGYFAVAAVKKPSSTALPWVCGSLSLLLAAAGFWYWFRTLRSARLRIQARTSPPEGVTPAELPLLLCGGKPDFALLVCHWGLLGYLTVTTENGGRVLLRKCMAMGSERREEERQVFEKLFLSSDVCQVGGNRYQQAAEHAVGVLRRSWTRRLFDRASGSHLMLRGMATIISALSLMAAMGMLLPPGPFKWLLVLVAFVAGGACGSAVWYGCVRMAVRDIRWMAAGITAALFLYIMGRIGGGLLLIFPALLLCAAVGLITRHGGRRTASGSDVMEQAAGFARFLSHADQHHVVQMLQRDGQYFYAMLLYACACGLGRAFARRMNGLELESCRFLTLPAQQTAGTYTFCLRLEELLQQMRG